MTRFLQTALSAAIGLLILLGGAAPPAAWAGPVDWHEVQASSDGRQWWDSGSLRVNRNGNLTVLSRFQPVGWYWLGGYARFREASLRRIESASSIGANS